MPIFLITHTNPDGTGVACAKVNAHKKMNALKTFHKRYPKRTAGVIGEKRERT